ncbi:hypothetical protein CERZMDRAFT_97055 [Cercospora zeae-maydis SCOH1-5]|uniref:Uncharacterized protein n=1 Tax=Cercospora zeae-maydis SCOH1-5 TaxID=717836 RepID=A0A6A6FGH6_9PEZI|nr:hypothetical protein CERZMDRAFT_97055 [Cercospora zeae-maydis SCOH1-5]
METTEQWSAITGDGPNIAPSIESTLCIYRPTCAILGRQHHKPAPDDLFPAVLHTVLAASQGDLPSLWSRPYSHRTVIPRLEDEPQHENTAAVGGEDLPTQS